MEAVLGALCEGTAERWRVHVVVAHDRWRTAVEERAGVAVIRAGVIARAASVPIAPTLPYHVWPGAYDCVVLHEPNPFAASVLAVRIPSARFVVWHHSAIVRPPWAPLVYGAVQRRLYRRADCVIVASPALALSPPVHGHRRIEVIPYGIRYERFLEGARATRVEAALAQYPAPRLLFVGRLVYYKGLNVLLEALVHCPAATLLIVGEGPLQGQLRARAAALGVDSRVAFLRAASEPEIKACYQASDVFVLPSTEITEAFGIVQLEAMASGLPVVSTNLPTGVPWVNQHGVTGLVVPAGQPAPLAAAIRTLLRDSGLRSKMAEAGRRRVAKTFSEATMVTRFTEVIEDLVVHP
jgi:glycosyltransferase involved in cell wall biosynthesis